MGRYHYVFPSWSNLFLPAVILVAMTAPLYVVFVVAYGFSPETTDVGYSPQQPIPYSHALHAGDLGIDCRYCHNTVENAAMAAIPPTETCMNCHASIVKDSPRLEPLRQSYETGNPILWNRVHDLPDFAYFSHAAHVNRGVSCVSCHGRVDRMDVVFQQEPLSMGWCLECHRDPVQHIRDPKLMTDLDYDFEMDPEARQRFATEDEYHEWYYKLNHIETREQCSTCHR